MMRVLWMRVRKALGDQRGQAGGRAWQLLATCKSNEMGLGQASTMPKPATSAPTSLHKLRRAAAS